MGNKHKHLDYIQAIINRMASNSFLLKGWAVTLISALFVFSDKNANVKYIIIAYIPVFVFWILDGYFLSEERLFIDLYKDVSRKDESQIDFSMDTREYIKNKRNTWSHSIFSTTLRLFYLSLILVMLIIMVVIN
ncbi:hypothetical protein ACFL2A_02150 [Thermodesulfobacteriota bacterium]